MTLRYSRHLALVFRDIHHAIALFYFTSSCSYFTSRTIYSAEN